MWKPTLLQKGHVVTFPNHERTYPPTLARKGSNTCIVYNFVYSSARLETPKCPVRVSEVLLGQKATGLPKMAAGGHIPLLSSYLSSPASGLVPSRFSTPAYPSVYQNQQQIPQRGPKSANPSTPHHTAPGPGAWEASKHR